MTAETIDTAQARERLVADLKKVITDADELLQATSGSTEAKVIALRERMSENLRAARHKLLDAEEALVAKTKQVARATDDYVHEHPWKAGGAAAGMGLIVGLLLGRR